MSSMYPSYGGGPTKPCPRCGVSLASNETRCAICGYYMTPRPTSALGNGSAQQEGSWNGGGPTISNPQNQLNNQQRPQFPAVNNGSPQTSPVSATFDVQQHYTQHPGPTNYQFQPIPMTPNSNGNFPSPHLRSVNTDRYYGISSPPQSSLRSFASSPNNSMQTGNISAPPLLMANYLPQPRKHGPNVKVVVGIASLLIILVVGGVLGYTLLNVPKQQTNTRGGSTTAVPTPTPKGTPIFADSFKDNSKQWNLLSDPGKFSAAIANNSLVVEDDSNQLLWELVPGGKTYGDCNVYVDASLTKGEQNNGYGIYIRAALGAKNDFAMFYRFEFYGDGTFAVFKGSMDGAGNVTTNRIVDYIQSPVIQKEGVVNHIQIAAKGSKMTVFVNGSVLKTISESSYAGGAIALFVSNLQGSKPVAQATFSNLAIYPPQA